MQVLLRLYTSLLPHLRRAALQTRPAWAGDSSMEEGLNPEGSQLSLVATIKREAAAVLNIGRVFHSEGMHHTVLVQAFEWCSHQPSRPVAHFQYTSLVSWPCISALIVTNDMFLQHAFTCSTFGCVALNPCWFLSSPRRLVDPPDVSQRKKL